MKYIVFAILFTLGFSTLQAQDVYTSSGRSVDSKRRVQEKEGFDPSKLIWGGGIMLGFGSGFANLGASPILGYRISDNFSAGIGIGYNYLKIKNYASFYNAQGVEQAYDLKTSLYNANVWARYIVWKNIFLQVQPEMNSLDVLKVVTVAAQPAAYKTIEKDRVLVPSVMVGGGVRQPISERVSFVALILYDVLKEQNSPYQGIDLRFGINVGF